MKLNKHPQLNINLAHTLSSIRFLATLTLFLFACSFPAKAVPLQETRQTVDVLLQVAKTPDCLQANQLLSTLTKLDLNSKQLTDLRPLSSFTNLKFFFLSSNQIADLNPLSSLANLTILGLDNNQIADLRLLSIPSNLTAH